jgi:hypothetical protein
VVLQLVVSMLLTPSGANWRRTPKQTRLPRPRHRCRTSVVDAGVVETVLGWDKKKPFNDEEVSKDEIFMLLLPLLLLPGAHFSRNVSIFFLSVNENVI